MFVIKLSMRYNYRGEPVVCVASVDGDKISKAVKNYKCLFVLIVSFC